MDRRDRKAGVVGQPRRAVDADRCPPEPWADGARRFKPDPSRVDSVDCRVEFGQAASALSKQFASPPQDSRRVTPEADVAVGQQVVAYQSFNTEEADG